MRKPLVVLVALSILVIGASLLAGRQGLMTGGALVFMLGAMWFFITQYRKKPKPAPISPDQAFDFDQVGGVPIPDSQSPPLEESESSVVGVESDFELFGSSQPSVLSGLSNIVSKIVAGLSSIGLSSISLPSLNIFGSQSTGDLDFLSDEPTTEEPEIVEIPESVSSLEADSFEELPPEEPTYEEPLEEPADEPPELEQIADAQKQNQEGQDEELPEIIQKRIESGLIGVGESVGLVPLAVLFDRGWVNRAAIYSKFE